MEYRELTIEPDPDGDGKGRSFTVHQVAVIRAREIQPDSPKGADRPVLLAYAGTPSTVRAFTANLRSGREAATTGCRYELLRSLGYRFEHSRPAPGQALVIAYLPDLFHLQPGAQAQQRLQILSAPPLWWLDRQEERLAAELGREARDYARAMAFVARLDTRTPLPISNDPDFHLRLYRRALDQPWLRTGDDDPSVLSFSGLDCAGSRCSRSL